MDSDIVAGDIVAGDIVAGDLVVCRAAAGVPRCGHCRAALPWLVAASDEDFAAVAEQALRAGREVGRQVGALPGERLLTWVRWEADAGG